MDRHFDQPILHSRPDTTTTTRRRRSRLLAGGDALGMRAAMSSHDDRVIYDARSATTSEGAEEEAEQLTNGSEHMLDRGYFHMRKYRVTAMTIIIEGIQTERAHPTEQS